MVAAEEHTSGAAAALPDLDVVVPVYRGRHRVGPCLEALAAQLRRSDRLVVVDDASADGTGTWVREAFPLAEVLRRGRNGGFAAAVNTGIRAGSAPLVAVVNDDCVVAPGWVAAVRGAAARRPDAGSVATCVLLQGSAGVVDSAGLVLGRSLAPEQRGRGLPCAAFAVPGDLLGPAGSAAVYRRAALAECGLFDVRLGSYHEDVDLALRLQRAGWDCVYEPAARSWHEGGASFSHGSPLHVRLIVRNELLVLLRDLPLSLLLDRAWTLAAHLARVALSLCLRHRRAGSWARGTAAAVGVLLRDALRPRGGRLAESVLPAGELARRATFRPRAAA